MSKFNIGDRVVIADPAYVLSDDPDDVLGWVDDAFYGNTGTVIKDVTGTNRYIGEAFDVMVEDSYSQHISAVYLTAAPVEPPAPTLSDGVYREAFGDTVLVREGKVVQILATGDGCAVDNDEHVEWAKDNDFLDGTTHLVAVAPESAPEIPLPADGFYSDRDGDLVQIKGAEQRYISGWGADPWEDAREAFDTYGPYTPLVEEDTTK